MTPREAGGGSVGPLLVSCFRVVEVLVQLEIHQLDQRYAALRIASRSRQQRLVASLLEHGQQTPVTVVPHVEEPERYVLIDGYARVRALTELGRDLVVALVWPLPEAEALVLSHKASRRRPMALEEGWLLWVLTREHGLSRRELCLRMERSPSWVSRRMALVTALPEVVQRAVQRGRVSPQAAMKSLVPLARANAAHCETLMASLGPDSLSVRDAARLYDAWRSADASRRERIVSQPGLCLAALAEPEPETSAASLLLADARILARVAARAERKVAEDALDGAGDELTRLLRRYLRQASTDLQRLLMHLDPHDAGRRDAHRHPPAAS